MSKRKQKLINEASKRFQQIMEYTIAGGQVMHEADDEEQNPEDATPQGGDSPMGGDAPQGDDTMGGAAPQGGDPMDGDAPQGGGPMDGDAPQGGPAGFAPEGGESMNGDPMGGGMDGGIDPMGGDAMGDTEPMQPDDEVIDVSELTDSQKETEEAVKEIDGRFVKAMKAIDQFADVIQKFDDKIDALQKEFEKRNPTQMEKLGLRAATSYPFNISPVEYWKNKTKNSNYSIEDDNNGIDQEQFQITANQLSGSEDWKGISDSLDDRDFLYNQTLKGALNF